MTKLITIIGRLVHQNDGQDLLEYGLLAALIALVAVASVTAAGNAIYQTFWQNIGQAI